MNFLNPLWLWALTGAALPILVHLFARKRGKVLKFSTLQFLRLSQMRTGRRRRLEEILVLLLRVLALACLLGALAGPVSRSRLFGERETAAVLVLDDSLSMAAAVNGRTAADRARELARSTLASLPEKSEVAVVTLSGRRLPFTRRRDDVGNWLQGIEPGWTAGNLPAALEEAFGLLERKTGNRVIYFLTDGQAYPWRNVVRSTRGGRLPALVLALAGPPAAGNLTCREVEPVPGRRRARCAVSNWGDRPAVAEVSLAGPDWRLARSLEIAAGESRSVDFDLPEEAGRLEGRVTATGDPLAADDACRVDLNAAGPRRVLVAGASGPALFYLEKALALDAETAGLELLLRDRSGLSAAALAGCGMLILADPGRLEPAVLAVLQDYVRSGGNLLYFAGDRVLAADFNRDWQAPGGTEFLMPARIIDWPRLAAPVRIAWAAAEHPLFLPFGSRALEYLKSVNFSRLVRLEPADGTVLMRGESGLPLLLEKRVGRGRIMLAAFLPGEEWTNLVFKPGFPVLMHHLARYLSGGNLLAVRTGEVFRPPAGGGRLFSPEGAEVPAEPAAGGWRLDRPGFWRLVPAASGTARERVISVNPDPEEGNLARIGAAEVRHRLPGVTVEFLEPERALAFLERGAAARDLSDTLLRLALLFILAEAGLAAFFHHLKHRAERHA